MSVAFALAGAPNQFGLSAPDGSYWRCLCGAHDDFTRSGNTGPGWMRQRQIGSRAWENTANGQFEPSGGRFRRRAAGNAAGKQAATEKGALPRTLAVHAAAAKTGRLAGGLKPRHDLAVAAAHARVEVGLPAADRVA